MKRFWDRVSNLGVNAGLSNREKRTVRLVNQFSATLLLLVLASTIFQSSKHLFIEGNIQLNTILFVLTSIPMAFVFYFNYKQKIYFAKFYFVLTQLFFHLTWAVLVGKGHNVEYVLLVFPVGIVILFQDKKTQLLLMAFTVIGFLICYYLQNNFEPLLPPTKHANIKLPAFIILLFSAYILTRFYQYEVTSAEENLINKNNELEHFARAASHDMKEPLRNISSFSSLIAYRHKEELSPEVAEYIGFIEKSSKRMTSLLSDLLSYATTGNSNESIENVDLNKVLEETKKDLASKISETKALIESEKLPVIPAYKTSMAQLFQNLINNAIKFQPKTENNTPTIKITAKLIDDYYKIVFEDNGIGIPKEKLKSIFETFNKLHSKSEYDGSGLGLATCKKIVELHQGKIDVQSKLGKGTSMILYLKAA